MAEDMKKELQSFWEVPAIAHFCSLFREVFKLIDFEIEKGNLNLRVGSHRLDSVMTNDDWGGDSDEAQGDGYDNRDRNDDYYGPNPLGVNAEKASFHSLPLYAKVKVLHLLCEWRLSKPDVEIMTKDFSGESLRILPLGQDHNGITYWYFYGTRLYSEDPEIKLKISLSSRHKQKSQLSDSLNCETLDETVTKKTKKKRRRKRSKKAYDFGMKRRRVATSSHRHTESEEAKSDEECETSNVCSKLRPELVVNTSGCSTPHNLTADPDDSSLSEMVKCIYRSRDDDDSLMSSEDMEVSSRGRSFVKKEVDSLSEKQRSFTDSPISASFTEDLRPYRTRNSQLKLKSEVLSEPKMRPLSATPSSTTAAASDQESADDRSWDQELLQPPTKSRWHLRCSTLDDWKRLTEMFSGSSTSAERRLHKMLAKDFLPALEDMFIQKEKEAAYKAQELTKRVSDRLEMKKLKKRQEMAERSRREAEERRRLAALQEERRKKEESERREARHQMRELEKERHYKVKQHAAEERKRRLELWQKRKEVLEVERKSSSSSDTMMDEKELNELDIQLEFEVMYGQMEKLLNYVRRDADAWPFMEPVTADIAPDYRDIVQHPMDFETMQHKIESRDYTNKCQFIDDMNLVFLNCLQYNGLKSEYTKLAQRLERVFLKGWKRYFPPSEMVDSNARIQQELLECLSRLGALDRQIKRELQVSSPHKYFFPGSFLAYFSLYTEGEAKDVHFAFVLIECS
ncbi:unnamed protein product [Soboliphyme baturini]|uniref:Bromo domain-containing protein n=1 Tax=Soboliphyme baturini TaxID=241478 RepID=A0A183IMN9_9BILA|nr:unnamed protein product [Soboliphyme baturini]